MTSSFIPMGAQETESREYLRSRASDQHDAVMESLDDDDEYRKEQEAKQAELEAQEADKLQQKQASTLNAAEQVSPPSVVGEVGTAVVGAGIDAVEGVGSTAEALLTGNMNTPGFKPTWLQMADEKEPMNRTVWGKVLRGVGEYVILNATINRVAKGAKAARVPGANALSKALTADGRSTTAGRLGRTAVKGALTGSVADFVSSYSESETISTELEKMFPSLPFDYLATKEGDSPLIRKVKNQVEGLGMGAITDIAFGFRGAMKAAKAFQANTPEVALKRLADAEKNLLNTQQQLMAKASAIAPEGKLTPEQLNDLRVQDPEFRALKQAEADFKKEYKAAHDAVDPKAIGENAIADSAARREANIDETVRTRLAEDPEGLKPDPFINSQLYDLPDQAILSPAGKGGFFQSMVDAARMEGDGVLKNGRRPSLYTESALEKRLSQYNPQRRKAIEDVAKQLQKELSVAPPKFKVEGLQKEMSVEELNQRATARYLDIIADLDDSPGDLESMRQLLMNSAQTRPDPVTGKTIEYLYAVDHRAAEMLINTTAGEISDIAQAARTIHGTMSTDRQVEMLTNRLQFLLMETGKGKYFKGWDLMALKDPTSVKKGKAVVEGGLQKVEKDVTDFIGNLKGMFDEDPQMVRHWMDLMSLADGNVQAFDDMYKYAKDQVFNWQSIIGVDGKRSAFMDSLTNIYFNSALAGAKTVARAFIGTGVMAFVRPVQAILGGAVTGDVKGMAMGMHTARASFEAIGEAFQVMGMAFKAGADNVPIPYASGEAAVMPKTMTDEWKQIGEIIMKQGTWQEKQMYNVTTSIYDFSNWMGVKYPLTAMSAIDSGSNIVMGRVDAKLQAFSKAWDETGGKDMGVLIQKYEKEFNDQIFNRTEKTMNSQYASRISQEAGLRLPISGAFLDRGAASFETFIQDKPIVRQFFMFMRTGWNALQVVQKHTPILASFNQEVSTILRATPDDLTSVMAYGITNPAQLLDAQMVTRGRIATGYLTVGAAMGLYVSGGLTGNGPADRETRNAWTQAGWKPRSIRLGDKWVSYDSLEPFTSFLAMTADIGDNANLLGETATQNWYTKLGYLIGMNAGNKSFMSGLMPLTEILSGKPDQQAAWLANVVNNQLPWAGVRNELANAINPGMRELDKDWTAGMQHILNRNPVLRNELPLKYDVLDGSVLKTYQPMTRILNAFSPFQVNDIDSPTRRTLRESGFDLVKTFNKDSSGQPLDAVKRSRIQNLMGQQGIEKQLEQLFAEPAVKKEMETYAKLRDLGIRNQSGPGGDQKYGLDVDSAKYIRRIEKIFNDAKRKAEAQLKQEYPELRKAAVERRAIEANQKSNRPDEALQRILENQNR